MYLFSSFVHVYMLISTFALDMLVEMMGRHKGCKGQYSSFSSFFASFCRHIVQKY